MRDSTSLEGGHGRSLLNLSRRGEVRPWGRIRRDYDFPKRKVDTNEKVNCPFIDYIRSHGCACG